MTHEPMPFDHRADAVLGAALREALDPGHHAAFVARVLARAGEARATAASWAAVLARWARAGLAAAILIALVAGYVVGRMPSGPAGRLSVTEALIEPPTQPPVVDVVLASVLE